MYGNKNLKSYVVIIDGCSNGRFYAKKLKNNYFCIHVQSIKMPPSFYLSGFNPTDYVLNIIYEGDIFKLRNLLKIYNPINIIAGSEFGVDLTEKLLQFFDLPSNDLSCPDARRNKYIMAKLANDNGLSVIPGIKTENCKIAIDFASLNGWPIVIKAINGSGGINFRLCRKKSDVKKAFVQFKNKKNNLGIPIQELLVQKFIQGVEYSVNTVSYNGLHYIVDVQKYTKADLPNGKRTYLNVELQRYDEISKLPGFIDYLYGVLDSVGITLGPAHTEIMYTSNGPILMETSARPGGGLPIETIAKCISVDQITASIYAYTDPSKFLSIYQKPYEVKQYFSLVHLLSHVDGIVKNFRHINEIKALSTFHSIYGLSKVNEKIVKTQDLDTTAGYVCLMGKDRGQIKKDYICIRDFERDGFFEVVTNKNFEEKNYTFFKIETIKNTSKNEQLIKNKNFKFKANL